MSGAIDFLKEKLYLQDLLREIVKLIKIMLTVRILSCSTPKYQENVKNKLPDLDM